MKFYKQLIESIIDIPRKDYAPGVFDNADTENPKLKQKVLDTTGINLELEIKIKGEK